MTCDEVAHNSSLEDASCTYGLVESIHEMEGACCSYAWVVCRPSLEETCGTYGLVEDIACLEGSCETCILEHVMYVHTFRPVSAVYIPFNLTYETTR